jgi:hypothetical protein
MKPASPRLIALAFAATCMVFTACGPVNVVGPPGGSSSPTGSPLPSSSPLPTVANLTGAWVFGETNEPAAGPVVSCNPFRLWNLVQVGSNVKASVEACLGPCGAYQEPSQGTNQSGNLHLVGSSSESPMSSPTPVTYEVSYNVVTQHLVGVRNGKTFWAAPFIQQTSGCGPRPM